MSAKPLLFRRVIVVAISVVDSERANKFYAETLGLPPAYEDKEQVGYLVGETILMLKSDWDQPPVQSPNPRVTIETNDARETEKALRARGVAISDPVEIYDRTHAVGSFLDTEGNKIWFCSYTSAT
ncbi:MAG: VOC family protein [Verrucomicrobia bacterium]|nr:VOC family protein [Verrucomicrobiota bacterium]MBV8485510.1 VOC family protein [Verrucomicrobiota bacterium]